jgi:hypothetical protein
LDDMIRKDRLRAIQNANMNSSKIKVGGNTYYICGTNNNAGRRPTTADTDTVTTNNNDYDAIDNPASLGPLGRGAAACGMARNKLIRQEIDERL